jgi:hypothetical protein
MDTWNRPCVNCSVDLPNGGSWINGKGPLCSACSINTMRLLTGGQARFDVSEIIALRAELTRLRAELAKAREDSARLDWLLPVLSLEDGDGDTRAVSLANQVMRKAMDTTITARAAIDKARKGEE